MTKASKAAIERGVELARGDWRPDDYGPMYGGFTALCDYIQKASDIAERCASSALRCDALLQELIVKDVDPFEEMFGRDSALTGFSTETIRSRIEAFGYKLVKAE